MFVLDELDKFLETIGLGKKHGPKVKKAMISLDDVPRINVEQLKMLANVQFPPGGPWTDRIRADSQQIDTSSSAHRHLTMDLLFVEMLKSILMAKLRDVPERHYVSARLMICDNDSYESIMKFQQTLARLKRPKDSIHRQLFKITAVFRLQDIIDQMDRTRKPMMVLKEDPLLGTQSGNYNYAIVKEVFPFLKMSDLVVVMNEAQDLDITTFRLEDRREHQVLQYLCYYARTSHLIDLRPIFKTIGQQHRTYDNVCIFKPDKFLISQNYHLKLPLSHLSFLASRLVHLARQLKLSLTSVSHRNGDPNGFSRIFSQIVETELKSDRYIYNSKDTPATARVLVLDRYLDLPSLLYHTDRYGPFNEQELDSIDGSLSNKSDYLTDSIQQLVQFEKLTDVLGTILKYTVNLRSDNRSGPAALNASLSSIIPINQSIRRHMENIKKVYESLNQGYLLILKLEASLREIYVQLRSLSEPLSADKQKAMRDRFGRISSALLQLIKFSGKSIKVSSLARVVCLMLDVINVFNSIHSKDNLSYKFLQQLKQKFLSGREFKFLIKSKSNTMSLDGGDEDPQKAAKTIRSIEAFDKISITTCDCRATLSIDEILDQFIADQLDSKTFSKLDLSGPKQIVSKSEVIIVIMLGSMSFDEVSRIKVMETSVKAKSNVTDILLITSGLIKPNDFLTSLIT